MNDADNWNIFLKNFKEYPKKTLDSIGLMITAVNILYGAKTIDEGLQALNYYTIYKPILLTNKGDYVYVLEFSKNEFTKENTIIIRNHIDPYLINKTSVIGESVLDKINLKTLQKIDLTSLNNTLVKNGQKIYNKDCIDEITKYFNYSQYDFYDPTNFNIILKRGYGVQIEKEGRKFLIGSGFNLDEKPKIIVINEKNLKFNRLIVFTISVTIWTVIVFFLLGHKKLPSRFYYYLLVIIGIVISICSAISFNLPGSLKREKQEKNEMIKRIITILSIFLGFAVLLSNAVNYKSFFKYFSSYFFIRFLITGFWFALASIIIPIFKESAPQIKIVASFQRVLLNISIGLIFFAVLYQIKEIKI